HRHRPLRADIKATDLDEADAGAAALTGSKFLAECAPERLAPLVAKAAAELARTFAADEDDLLPFRFRFLDPTHMGDLEQRVLGVFPASLTSACAMAPQIRQVAASVPQRQRAAPTPLEWW